MKNMGIEQEIEEDLEDNLLRFALNYYDKEVFFLNTEGQRLNYGDCKSSLFG
jgi:hypothetical protein